MGYGTNRTYRAASRSSANRSPVFSGVSCRQQSFRTLRVRVHLVMLAQQVFAIVVAIRRADDAMNVLAGRSVRILGESREVGGALMIELDENDGAMDAVVVDARRI